MTKTRFNPVIARLVGKKLIDAGLLPENTARFILDFPHDGVVTLYLMQFPNEELVEMSLDFIMQKMKAGIDLDAPDVETERAKRAYVAYRRTWEIQEGKEITFDQVDNWHKDWNNLPAIGKQAWLAAVQS